MRRITISVLSVFVVLPAIAGGRLPVVNIASGGVSARAAFGEVDTKPVTVAATTQKKQASPTRIRRVVSRSATPTPAVDAGEKIVASNDVLTPRRPSNDLWAKSDSALRMPMPSEFSVIRTDSVLPEESLDKTFAVAPVTKSVAPVNVPAAPAPRVAKTQVAPTTAPVASESDLDTQIARLAQLQKRADDSVRTVSRRVISAPIAEMQTHSEPRNFASAAPVKSESVSLHRMVVPMETDDVVMRTVEKTKSPRIAAVRDDMTKMNPNELRRAFRKTFLEENKHLSTFSIDSRFDTASDMSASIEGFTANHDLSEGTGIRSLEIKIKFRNADSALSRDNYTLLTEYAGIVVNKPTRAIQVAIPSYMTMKSDERKLAARRLAIIEQALTDNGVSKQRIVPVLSNRDEPSFVLRIISGDEYETLTQQSRNMFGDTVSKKTYKSMSW